MRPLQLSSTPLQSSTLTAPCTMFASEAERLAESETKVAAPVPPLLAIALMLACEAASFTAKPMTYTL